MDHNLNNIVLIKICCQKLLENHEDYIKYIRKIKSLWINSGLEENDLYYFIVAMDDETETIPEENTRENFSNDFLKQKDKEKIKIYEENRDDLNFILNEIILLCDSTINKYLDNPS